MVVEQLLVSRSLLHLQLMLIIGALDTNNTISPALLNEFHSSFQSHFLFLDLSKLLSHLPMFTDFFTSSFRHDDVAFIISALFDVDEVMAGGESSGLLDLGEEGLFSRCKIANFLKLCSQVGSSLTHFLRRGH